MTSLRLATDILVKHGDVSLRLRPSLRAAYRLEMQHGVNAVLAGLFQGHSGIIADVLAEATDSLSAHRILAERIDAEGARKALTPLQVPLLDFVAASFGLNSKNNADNTERPARKPVPMEEHLVSLFEIGTGWLGWTPADTWSATPAEIIAAQRGLVAKLRAVNGGADTNADQYHPGDGDITPEELQANLARLRALSGQRIGTAV